MLQKDDYEILKLQLNDNLFKSLTNINNFLKKSESFKKFKNDINKIICEHPTFKSRNRISLFSDLINNAETSLRQQTKEVQEKAEMKLKRKEELNQINNLIQSNYQKLIDNSKNNNLLPSAIPTQNDQNKEDDIIVEDTKDVEDKKYLKKKRKKAFENKKKEFHDYTFTNCYICKQKLYPDDIHLFYGNMCKKCGDYNYSFRSLTLNLSGRIAIVTGGRVKIGYYIATKLLSYGCKVLTTSRFPKDTLLKYQQHPEYEKWKNNLLIYPIDFRFFNSVVKFIDYINQNFSHIDILINNAAQTVRKTTSYYKYLLPIEMKELKQEDENKIIKTDYLFRNQNKLDDELKLKNNKEEIKNALTTKQDEYNEFLPLSVIASQIKIMEEKKQPIINELGNDGQPYDFSHGKNSWYLEFDEIPFQEFTEVQMINAWVPYYLCVKLKPLMLKSPFTDKYIVNVTAVEGIFNHFKKTTHVHTNMAKASLNMFTRTCAKYLKNFNIYMTCVDTGWVSPMSEINKILDNNTKNNFEEEFKNIPLDELDGAMRVLHPIIEGIKNKNYLSGILLKDYVKSNW